MSPVFARMTAGIRRAFGARTPGVSAARREIGIVRARLDELEQRLVMVSRGHEELARAAEDHLRALQTAVERMQQGLADLASGHAALARTATTHLAGLQAHAESTERRLADVASGDGHVIRSLERHMAGLQSGHDRLQHVQDDVEVRLGACRAVLVTLEACLTDVERSQTAIAEVLVRAGIAKAPG